MNVYACCYRGNLGYGCRIRGRRWMFVPEFGQVDHCVHRNVALAELRFANRWAQDYERDREQPWPRIGIVNWLRRLPSTGRTRSVGGLLCNFA
ncbi:MAG: hypothetical protein HYY48_11115 [Gammaproteobacteria bacterium]|nr:hypothetical protein [Gammaproteobacteria bacterium]